MVKGLLVDSHFVANGPKPRPALLKLEFHSDFLFEPVFDLFLQAPFISQIRFHLLIPGLRHSVRSLQPQHLVLNELGLTPLFILQVFFRGLHQGDVALNLADLLIKLLDAGLVLACPCLALDGLLEELLELRDDSLLLLNGTRVASLTFPLALVLIQVFLP